MEIYSNIYIYIYNYSSDQPENCWQTDLNEAFEAILKILV
jgi:hypothetical protein